MINIPLMQVFALIYFIYVLDLCFVNIYIFFKPKKGSFKIWESEMLPSGHTGFRTFTLPLGVNACFTCQCTVHGGVEGCLVWATLSRSSVYWIFHPKKKKNHNNTHTLACAGKKFIGEDFYLIEIHTRHLELLMAGSWEHSRKNTSTLVLPLYNTDFSAWLNKKKCL